jgi:hypothetical protein
MRMRWHLRSVTPKLGAVLIAVSLLVVMTAAGGQAASSQESNQARPVAAETAAWVHLDGGCFYTRSGGFTAWETADSNVTGTGYVNLYKRTTSGDILYVHVTHRGRSFFQQARYPYRTGYWFATYGFNGPGVNASGGERCWSAD